MSYEEVIAPIDLKWRREMSLVSAIREWPEQFRFSKDWRA